MTNTPYANAGIYYVEATEENFALYPEVKDGRDVLLRCEKDDGEWVCVDRWGRGSGAWLYTLDDYITHFAPLSLDPIGEHVAIECAVQPDTAGEPYEVYGISGMDVPAIRKERGRQISATATVRIPVRRPPHGEA